MLPDKTFEQTKQFIRYLRVTLLQQVQLATKKRRSLSGNSSVITKEFEPDDLQNSLYLRAYGKAIKLERELTQEEVEHLAYLVGYQGYKPRLPMYRSKSFGIDELLDGCDKNISRQDILNAHEDYTQVLQPDAPETLVIKLAIQIARERLETKGEQ